MRAGSWRTPPTHADLEKLETRIQALRAKTIANGCTEDEALSAAAKVAELLDRYDLSLSDVEMRAAPCELAYQASRKKRIPLDECIGAVAEFCDCRVWREKRGDGAARYVFFGLPSDIAGAHASPHWSTKRSAPSSAATRPRANTPASATRTGTWRTPPSRSAWSRRSPTSSPR